MRKLSGAQILIESLISQGVDTMFGYPGGAVLNIFDALHEKRDDVNFILTAHEQGAAHAADGYARSTGRTGVVLATSGPGATNLVTGIATAYLDSVPLVAITGNVPLDLMGRDGFQEVDITNITNPIVKHNFLIKDAADIAPTIRQAFVIANSGRKGPVLVDIPKDVTAQVVEYIEAGRYETREDPAVSLEAVAEAARIISDAKRPLIYAGGGVTFSDSSDLLVALAEHIDAPVCVSIMGLSSMPASHPLFFGMVGMHGTPTANRAVCDCDVLIALGARFSDRVAGNRKKFAESARVIHIDIDASEISKNVAASVPVVGSARDVVPVLLQALPSRKNPEWLDHLEKYRTENPLPMNGIAEGVNPYKLIRALKESLGDDGIVATDVGQHQMWTALYYPFSKPRSFISSCGLGTMGYGMGAAIGASMGNPKRRVALVTGDGSFHMNMNELATAVTNKLPITIILMNNHILGMVNQWQTFFYEKRYSYTELDLATDYVKLAEAMGATGIRLERQEDISPALERAAECEGPCLIECPIGKDVRVFPFIPPGGSAQDAIYCD